MSNPLDSDDFRIPVTRIEIEPLDGGVIRWSCWHGPKRAHFMTARIDRPDEMRKLFETTRILATAVASQKPQTAGRCGPA